MRPAGEEILDRDSGGVSRGHRHLDPLLRLDRLMEPVAPRPSLRGTAGELIDDHDLPVADDILPIAVEKPPRPQGPFHRVVKRQEAEALEERGAFERPDTAPARPEKLAALLLHVDFEVLVDVEKGRGPGCETKQRFLGRLSLSRWRGDDQRRAGLVDEDVVCLVDEREPIGTLEEFRGLRCGVAGEHRPEITAPLGDLAPHEAIFQEVESELLRRAVGHVLGIRLAALIKPHLRLDDADRHPEDAVDRLHPLCVALGEVVVDGGEVGPFAAQGIERQREGGNECLPLAGLHLDDRPAHQRHPGKELDVVMPHAVGATAGLPRRREALHHQRLDRLARLGPVRQRACRAPQGRITQACHLCRQALDLGDDPSRRGVEERTRPGGDPLEPSEHVGRHPPHRYLPPVSGVQTARGWPRASGARSAGDRGKPPTTRCDWWG